MNNFKEMYKKLSEAYGWFKFPAPIRRVVTHARKIIIIPPVPLGHPEH